MEQLYEKIDIRAKLNDLESKDKDTLRSTIFTLSGISFYTKRRDALYVLCGYYQLEIQDLDDIEFFCDSLRNQCHYELYKMILKDLSLYKDFYRKKSFTNDVVSLLNAIINRLNNNEKDELQQIVENAVWGKKLKAKFIDKIREDERFEDDEIDYLFG